MLAVYALWSSGCEEAELVNQYGHAAPAGPSEDEEPFVHSFHLDACQSPELRRALLGLTACAQRVLAGLGRTAEAWKRHQALWKSNKQLALDKFKVVRRVARSACCRSE